MQSKLKDEKSEHSVATAKRIHSRGTDQLLNLARYDELIRRSQQEQEEDKLREEAAVKLAEKSKPKKSGSTLPQKHFLDLRQMQSNKALENREEHGKGTEPFASGLVSVKDEDFRNHFMRI